MANKNTHGYTANLHPLRAGIRGWFSLNGDFHPINAFRTDIITKIITGKQKRGTYIFQYIPRPSKYHLKKKDATITVWDNNTLFLRLQTDPMVGLSNMYIYIWLYMYTCIYIIYFHGPWFPQLKKYSDPGNLKNSTKGPTPTFVASWSCLLQQSAVFLVSFYPLVNIQKAIEHGHL